MQIHIIVILCVFESVRHDIEWILEKYCCKGHRKTGLNVMIIRVFASKLKTKQVVAKEISNWNKQELFHSML